MALQFRRAFLLLALALGFALTFAGAGDGEESASLEARAQNRSTEEKDFYAARDAAAAQRAEDLRAAKIVKLEKVVDNGDSAGRLDIVILSDGYTDKDLAGFDKTVGAIVDKISDVEPFVYYTNYINFWAAWVESDESGITANGKTRNTPFGVNMNGSVLTCDNAKVNKFCDKYFPGNDLTIVVGNVSGGRATGTIGWTTGDAVDKDWLLPRPGGIVTLNKDGVDFTVIHELGHAFAHLGDEYVEPGRARGKENMLDHSYSIYQNCSKESDPKLVRWHYWNIPEQVWNGKPSPTRWPAGKDIVGCYEGAFLYDKGVYRPQSSCLMKCDVATYCPPCMEAAECTFFQYVSPIDSVWPRQLRHTLWKGESLDLYAKFLSVTGGRRKSTMTFNLSWYIDGKPCFDAKVDKKELSTTLTVDARSLSAGEHEICVKVDFTTPRARMDFGLLTSNCVWIVDVRKEEKPDLVIKRDDATVRDRVVYKGEEGVPELTLRVSLENGPSTAVLRAGDLPEGANFDAAAGLFKWTPGPEQHGLFQPSFFVQAEGAVLAEKSVEIYVAGPEGKNKPPVLLFIPDVDIDEGKEFRRVMTAWDADGDRLRYSGNNLPRGASVDPATGEFSWSPLRHQSGLYKDVEIVVSDGRGEFKDKFDITVRDTNPGFDTSGETVDMFWKLRDASYDSRMNGLDALADYPVGAQIVESIRLLRDPAPAVRQKALSYLKGIFSATIKVDVISGEEGNNAEALNMQYHSYLVHAFFAVKNVLLWSIIDFPEAMEYLDKVFEHMEHMKDKLDSQAQKELKQLREVMTSMKSYNEWRGK